MKIIQPSKRSKKSSEKLNEPARSEQAADQLHGAREFRGREPFDGNPKQVSHKADRAKSSKRNSTKSTHAESCSDQPDRSNDYSSKNVASSKSEWRKLKRRARSDDYETRIYEEGGKDSEYDFDTSKLEAMPKDSELEPAPNLDGKKRRRSELQSQRSASTEPLELITDPAKKEFNELFARGLRLLAMREHSVKEIATKLFDKSEASDTVYAVVDELLEKKYLSDERFAESYVRARANRGFGPVKIKAELKQKGVSSGLIQDYLDEGAALWFDNAASQYQKKYGDSAISDYNAWTKRARFMQSRGFTMEHIHVTVPRIEFD